MPSKNVETLQGAHESWNRRDFQGVTRAVPGRRNTQVDVYREVQRASYLDLSVKTRDP